MESRGKKKVADSLKLHAANVPATLEELAHERFALAYLIPRDELVGLVCLIDAAGSAHHRRHAASLKESRFGAERDLSG